MNDLVRDKMMTESGDITLGAEILAGATVSDLAPFNSLSSKN